MVGKVDGWEGRGGGLREEGFQRKDLIVLELTLTDSAGLKQNQLHSICFEEIEPEKAQYCQIIFNNCIKNIEK